jgi:hypothetical protein
MPIVSIAPGRLVFSRTVGPATQAGCCYLSTKNAKR